MMETVYRTGGGFNVAADMYRAMPYFADHNQNHHATAASTSTSTSTSSITTTTTTTTTTEAIDDRAAATKSRAMRGNPAFYAAKEKWVIKDGTGIAEPDLVYPPPIIPLPTAVSVGVSGGGGVQEPTVEEARMLAAAHMHKTSGNTLFTTAHYLAAVDAYALALSYTPANRLREAAVVHSNLAACFLRPEVADYDAALRHADAAAVRRPGWAKALLRRARAREALGGWRNLQDAHQELRDLLAGNVQLETPLTDAERVEAQRTLDRVVECAGAVCDEAVGCVVHGMEELGKGGVQA